MNSFREMYVENEIFFFLSKNDWTMEISYNLASSCLLVSRCKFIRKR